MSKLITVVLLMSWSLVANAQKSERYFERKDASMRVIYTNEIPTSISMIVPSPGLDDGVLTLDGVLQTTDTPKQYLFVDEYSDYTWKVVETETTLSFDCLEGDCYDKNGKYGLWKEPFVLKHSGR